MTSLEIRTLAGTACANTSRDEKSDCASGTPALLVLLGEIAAQLSDLNHWVRLTPDEQELEQTVQRYGPFQTGVRS